MASIFYAESEPKALPARFLASTADGDEQRIPFYDRLEIGRYSAGRTPLPGELLIDDPTISRRHCFITQTADGRCWVRDVSRNGTRLDGRRLVPNLEHEMQPGQTLGVGERHEFRLAGESVRVAAAGADVQGATVAQPGTTAATVLVGDIRDYTVLVRTAPAERLQQSVSRVFEILTSEVIGLGGTVKEYQGDALFAFWERADDPHQVTRACAAALALDRKVRELARDNSVWSVDGFELEMDWALSTGMVVIDSFGANQPTGLSMVGEPVVRAFRMEKFATGATGCILACEATQLLAARAFRFQDLGKMQAKGFDTPDRVYALLGELDGGAGSAAGEETLTEIPGVDP